MDYRGRDKHQHCLLKWGRPVTTKMFAVGSELNELQKKAVMDILHWIENSNDEGFLKWTPIPGKLKVVLCLPYPLGFACNEQKIPPSLVNLQKPILIVATSRHCLSHLEKHLSTNRNDGLQPYLLANGFLTTEDINQGAYYEAYVVKSRSEAEKVTSAAKYCDIILADIQYCYDIPNQCVSIVLVYGNHDLTTEQQYHLESKFARSIKVVLFTTPPLLEQFVDDHASERSPKDPEDSTIGHDTPKLVKYSEVITKTDRLMTMLNKRQISVLYKVLDQVRNKEFKKFPVVISMEAGKGDLEILSFLPYFLGKKSTGYVEHSDNIDLTKPILIITTRSESMTKLKKYFCDKPYLIESGYLKNEELAEDILYKTHVVQDSFDAATISKVAKSCEIVLTAKGYYQSFPDDCFSAVVVFESNLLNKKVEKDITLKFDNTKIILFRVASHEPANMFAAEVKSRLEYLQDNKRANYLPKLVQYGKIIKEKLLFGSLSILTEQQQLGLRAMVDWFVYPDSKNEPALIETTIGFEQAGVMITCFPYMLGWAVSSKLIPSEEINLSKPILVLGRSADAVNQVWDLVHVNPFFVKTSLLASSDALTGALYSAYLVKDAVSAVNTHNIIGLDEVVVSSIELMEYLPEDCFSVVVIYTLGTFEEELQKQTIKKFHQHSKIVFINVHFESHQNCITVPEEYPSISVLLKFGPTIRNERLFGKESKLTEAEQNGLRSTVEWFTDPNNKHLPIMLNDFIVPESDSIIVSCLPYMLGWAVDAGVLSVQEMDLNSKRILIIYSDSIALDNLKKIMYYPYLLRQGILDSVQIQSGAYYRTKLVSEDDIIKIDSFVNQYDIFVADLNHKHLIPEEFFTIVLVYYFYISDPPKQMEITQKFAESSIIFIRASLEPDRFNHDQFLPHTSSIAEKVNHDMILPKIELQPTLTVHDKTSTKNKLINKLSPFFGPKKSKQSCSERSQPWPEDDILLSQGLVEKHSRYTISKLKQFQGKPESVHEDHSKQFQTKENARLLNPEVNKHHEHHPLHHASKNVLNPQQSLSTNIYTQSNLEPVAQNGAVPLLGMGPCSKCMQAVANNSKTNVSAHVMKPCKHESNSKVHKLKKKETKVDPKSTKEFFEKEINSKGRKDAKHEGVTIKATQWKLSRTYYAKKLRVYKNSKGTQATIDYDIKIKPGVYRRYDSKYSKKAQQRITKVIRKQQSPTIVQQTVKSIHDQLPRIDVQQTREGSVHKDKVKVNAGGTTNLKEKQQQQNEDVILENEPIGRQSSQESKLKENDAALKDMKELGATNDKKLLSGVHESHIMDLIEEKQLEEEEHIIVENKLVGLDYLEKGEQTSQDDEGVPLADVATLDTTATEREQLPHKMQKFVKSSGDGDLPGEQNIQQIMSADDVGGKTLQQSSQKEKEHLPEHDTNLFKQDQKGVERRMQKLSSSEEMMTEVSTSFSKHYNESEILTSSKEQIYDGTANQNRNEINKEVLKLSCSDGQILPTQVPKFYIGSSSEAVDSVSKQHEKDFSSPQAHISENTDEVSKNEGIEASDIQKKSSVSEKHLLESSVRDTQKVSGSGSASIHDRKIEGSEVQLQSSSEDHITSVASSVFVVVDECREQSEIQISHGLERVPETADSISYDKNDEVSEIQKQCSSKEHISEDAGSVSKQDKKELEGDIGMISEPIKLLADAADSVSNEVKTDKDSTHQVQPSSEDHSSGASESVSRKDQKEYGSEIRKLFASEKSLSEAGECISEQSKIDQIQVHFSSGKHLTEEAESVSKQDQKKYGEDGSLQQSGSDKHLSEYGENISEKNKVVCGSEIRKLFESEKSSIETADRDSEQSKLDKDDVQQSSVEEHFSKDAGSTSKQDQKEYGSEIRTPLASEKSLSEAEDSVSEQRNIDKDDKFLVQSSSDEHLSEDAENISKQVKKERGDEINSPFVSGDSSKAADSISKEGNTDKDGTLMVQSSSEECRSHDPGSVSRQDQKDYGSEIRMLFESEKSSKTTDSLSKEAKTGENGYLLVKSSSEEHLTENAESISIQDQQEYERNIRKLFESEKSLSEVTDNLPKEVKTGGDSILQVGSSSKEHLSEYARSIPNQDQKKYGSEDRMLFQSGRSSEASVSFSNEDKRDKNGNLHVQSSAEEHVSKDAGTISNQDQKEYGSEGKIPLGSEKSLPEVACSISKEFTEDTDSKLHELSNLDEHISQDKDTFNFSRQDCEEKSELNLLLESNIVDSSSKQDDEKSPNSIDHMTDNISLAAKEEREKEEFEMQVISHSEKQVPEPAFNVYNKDDEKVDKEAQKQEEIDKFGHEKQTEKCDDKANQQFASAEEQVKGKKIDLKVNSENQMGRSRFSILRQRLKKTLLVDKETSTDIEGIMNQPFPFLFDFIQENQDSFKASPEKTLALLLHHALANYSPDLDSGCMPKFYSEVDTRSSTLHSSTIHFVEKKFSFNLLQTKDIKDNKNQGKSEEEWTSTKSYDQQSQTSQISNDQQQVLHTNDDHNVEGDTSHQIHKEMERSDVNGGKLKSVSSTRPLDSSTFQYKVELLGGNQLTDTTGQHLSKIPSNESFDSKQETMEPHAELN